jgi:Tfp pilus assembly protein PilX
MHTTNHCQVRSRRKTDKGAILMVVLIVMIALLGLGMTGLFLTSGSIQMNTNINLRNQALVVAEAGIERARGILNNQTVVPPIPGMLAGSTSPVNPADEVPTSVADCQGARRGAILVDQITTGCATSPTPANCTLQGVPYPSSVDRNDLPALAGPVARSTLGTYTVFIRQDQADCRMGNFNCEYAPVNSGGVNGDAGAGGAGGTSGVTTCTIPAGAPNPPNGAIVIRSEGVASDGRTRVVLEVTMTPSQGPTRPNVTPMSALCAAGANGCDDNSSVQNGIVVNSNITQTPPSYGGATSQGGATGTGGAGGAGGAITVPVTGPSGGTPSTGGSVGTGGAATGGATGTGGSTCVYNRCLTVATIGISGPWDAVWSGKGAIKDMGTLVKSGSTYFNDWLALHASACAIQNIDLSTTPTITKQTLQDINGNPFKIIVLLDLYHTIGDREAWVAAKLNTHYPNYPGTQRALKPGEVNVILDWINAGGGLVTTMGYMNIPAEPSSANKILRPFGVSYSTNAADGSSVLGYGASVKGFKRSAPISCAITDPCSSVCSPNILQSYCSSSSRYVGNLQVTLGTNIVGWDIKNSVETGLRTDSNYFATFGSQGGYTMGVAFLANKSSTSGKVVVWGDEWITYDDVWNSNNTYQPEAFWNNVLNWFSTGCTP